jgi:hypothetical protein
MSEENYWDALREEITDAYVSGTEAFFRKFGQLQNDFVNGAVTYSRVIEAGANAEFLALKMEKVRASLSELRAAAGEVMTPAEQSLDKYWQKIIDELKNAHQSWTQVDEVAAIRNFGANASKTIGLVANFASAWEVYSAYKNDDGEGTASALGGWVGGSLGSVAAYKLAGVLVAGGPGGWTALVIVGVFASVGALIGTTGGGMVLSEAYKEFTDYEARRTTRQRIDAFFNQINQAYGADSLTAQNAKTELSDAVDKLGRMDGTWMSGYSDWSNQKKADITALLIGSAMGRAPDPLFADLLKVFEFEWGNDRLPLRDAVINVLAALSGTEHAYNDAAVETDAAGHIIVHVENVPTEHVHRLSDLIELFVDDADQAGVPMRPDVDTIVIKEASGVVVGSSNDDAVIGSASDDYILGGEGNDYLVGGEGNDKLSGGVGHDVLLGGVGTDTLEGGEGSDLLYGGRWCR